MPVIKEAPDNKECEREDVPETKCEEEVKCCCEKKPSNPLCTVFGSLEVDDIIIIGILLVLLFEGSNDILIIALLGIILFF